MIETEKLILRRVKNRKPEYYINTQVIRILVLLPAGFHIHP